MSDENPDPPLRRTQRSLSIALLRARETVMGPIRDMLATSGVNEPKWRVLRVVQEHGAMEDEGLIARTTPPQDRRKTVVTITTAGEALIRAHSAAPLLPAGSAHDGGR